MPTLVCFSFFFFNDTATTEIYTLSLHDALPISRPLARARRAHSVPPQAGAGPRLVSGDLVSDAPRVPADVVAALDRAPGRALMLGHVHPDADVLGTLLAIGEALQARRGAGVARGPPPPPRAPSVLPRVRRHGGVQTPPGARDV